MKRITAAVLALTLLLAGCGKSATVNDTSSADTDTSTAVETRDTASKKTSDTDKKDKKMTDTDSDKKKKTNSKGTDSDKKKSSSSKSTSSKASSSKASSSKTSSSSSKTNSSAQDSVITYTYEIGDANDPIRQVEPEKVQQYIIEEEPIMIEPEPEATFVNEFEDVDPKIIVEDSWFDDCVFMGDSLSVGLSMYNDANGVFGDAKFVCASSLSYWNSQWDLYRPGNVHPYYCGQKILLEDAVNVTGAKKAIITLGMNDIGIWGPEGVIDYARSLLNKIRAKSPDVKIYFQTVSPMIYYAQKQHLNNYLIREFNNNLKEFAAEEGCGFLDSYNALADSNGNLPYEFCSDPGALGLHLTFAGCAVWTDFLKANVGTAYPGDEITPETDSQTESDTESLTETDSSFDTETDIASEDETETESAVETEIDETTEYEEDE